ncbi:MAG: hypothetical protein JWP03_2276 [Phycisphaerales bacterium]|nr:hypothetical protein [Phycisphaerales bacterium]
MNKIKIRINGSGCAGGAGGQTETSGMRTFAARLLPYETLYLSNSLEKVALNRSKSVRIGQKEGQNRCGGLEMRGGRAHGEGIGQGVGQGRSRARRRAESRAEVFRASHEGKRFARGGGGRATRKVSRFVARAEAGGGSAGGVGGVGSGAAVGPMDPLKKIVHNHSNHSKVALARVSTGVAGRGGE